MHAYISIVGASEHNLKKISINLPRNKLVVFTGVSGSGKSSLAFNTIYAEGQRRYLESLSTYARQFIGRLDKPAVESIEGLSPAIAIEQKTISKNPRSTVGTITEIYDYYRLLYARIGVPHDPDTNKPLKRQTIDEICDSAFSYANGTKLTVLAPVVRAKKGMHKKVLEDAKKLGFRRIRINGEIKNLEETIVLSKTHKYSIDIITGRVVIKPNAHKRITEIFERALELSAGNAIAIYETETKTQELHYSLHYAYTNTELSVPEMEPNLFSFNNPMGSCSACAGLGNTVVFDPHLVIPDMKKSFNEGAIVTIGNWKWYIAQVTAFITIHNESLDTPFTSWKKDSFNALLYGSPKEITFSLNGTRVYKRQFAGILNDLDRWYKTTSNQKSREWLEQFTSSNVCGLCKGGRLRREALHVKVTNIPIHRLTQKSVKESMVFFNTLTLNRKDSIIAKEILREIKNRLAFLHEVGLDYLSLDRYAGTLSGGESQRIRLASHIGSALVGVMYILDEPTIGLHQRDNDRLITTLQRLRDLGNTVIVVEHDDQVIRCADFVVDIGPEAGKNGGTIVAQGTPKQIAKMHKTLTGKYLAGKLYMDVPKRRRENNTTFLKVFGAREHNLKNIEVWFPLGCFCVITGVSGSGKSTLLQEIIYPYVYNQIYHSKIKCGKHKEIQGIEHIDKIVDIDQSPIGRTPRSNPGTYVKIFDGIRDLFAQLPESKARGYSKGRFSFNVSGGRCEACQGVGTQMIEMHFLADVHVTCDICKGKRFNRETLDVYYKGKNIYDVLCMTVDEAEDFFKSIPNIARRLRTLQAVGMGYVGIGQPATTLSGGEAQRIKLALELSKVSTGKTLYLLDEPTTGLHQADILNLLGVLHELVDRGNTIIIIEHNLEIIKQADYIVDLGPEGGDNGGSVIAHGSPEKIMSVKESFTGKYLRKYITR